MWNESYTKEPCGSKTAVTARLATVQHQATSPSGRVSNAIDAVHQSTDDINTAIVALETRISNVLRPDTTKESGSPGGGIAAATALPSCTIPSPVTNLLETLNAKLQSILVSLERLHNRVDL